MKKLIRLIPLLALPLLTACGAWQASGANVSELETAYKENAFKTGTKGIVVLHADNGIDNLASMDLSVRLMPENKSNLKFVNIGGKNSALFGKSKSVPVVLMLPAGKYTMENFRLSNSGQYMEFNDRFSASFEVKANQINYLGEISLYGQKAEKDSLIKIFTGPSRTYIILSEVKDSKNKIQETLTVLEGKTSLKTQDALITIEDQRLKELKEKMAEQEKIAAEETAKEKAALEGNNEANN